jgi:16S rRNA (adenine1518-N6/adenine1519-N6)-dimethyltransferase
VLTVQQEVASRICALPGEMSLLALSVQVYGRPQIRAHIPARAFNPPPNVHSSVLCMDIYAEPVIPFALLDAFFSLARAGFSQKRKTLRNSLAAGLRLAPSEAEKILAAAGIEPRRRAETLSVEEWKVLSGEYQAMKR